MIWKREDNDK